MNTQINGQPSIFVSLIENEDALHEGRRFPASQTIPCTDFIYERDDSGAEREVSIRYIPGERSIYVEKQSTDKKFVPEPLIIGSSGSLVVQHNELLKKEYLLKSNYNEANPNRMPGKSAIFRLWSEEKQAKKEIEEYRQDKELRDKILMLDSDELESLAVVLGNDVGEKKFNILLRDILVISDNNPELVRSALMDVETSRRAIILKAFKRNIIFHDAKTNEIKWKSGGVITKVPLGKDCFNYLSDQTFLAGYETFMDEIAKLLSPEKEREVMIREKEKTEESTDLFQNAIEAGIITKKHFWFSLSGEVKGSKYANFAKSLWDAKRFFTKDSELQEKVKRALYGNKEETIQQASAPTGAELVEGQV